MLSQRSRDIVIGGGQIEEGEEAKQMEATDVMATEKVVPAPIIEKDISPQESQSATLYDLHIRVPEALRDKLKDTAKIAHNLKLIEEPELRLLMALFIDYGMAVLKAKWLEKMGYR